MTPKERDNIEFKVVTSLIKEIRNEYKINPHINYEDIDINENMLSFKALAKLRGYYEVGKFWQLVDLDIENLESDFFNNKIWYEIWCLKNYIIFVKNHLKVFLQE